MERNRRNSEAGQGKQPQPAAEQHARGLAGWLLARMRRAGGARPRLRLVERIALAPRQSLALVEAEGRRLLVASSSDGAPAFYPLDERGGDSLPFPISLGRRARHEPGHGRAARVSW